MSKRGKQDHESWGDYNLRASRSGSSGDRFDYDDHFDPSDSDGCLLELLVAVGAVLLFIGFCLLGR